MPSKSDYIQKILSEVQIPNEKKEFLSLLLTDSFKLLTKMKSKIGETTLINQIKELTKVLQVPKEGYANKYIGIVDGKLGILTQSIRLVGQNHINIKSGFNKKQVQPIKQSKYTFNF